MKTPSLPKNEIQRLIALKQYQILDTAAEDSFDDLTSLASQICNTPIALISLLDESRQWFKSSVGLEAKETPRNISFCGHAILGEDIFEVPDAALDERFSDNPLVTDNPNIRFYAGYPLVTEAGYALGTLCVIDQTPKHLNDQQRTALRKLGRQVVMQIEHRMSMLQLSDMAMMLERTGEMASVGGWELDLWSMTLQWTKEVFHIHELDEGETPNVETALSFYPPEAQSTLRTAIEQAIAQGTPWDLELPLVTAKHRQAWVRAQGSAIMHRGKAKRLIGAFQDITQRKKSELALAWLNRALSMLSECNETLIHMKDEKHLITEVCRIIVNVGGYRMAWVGYAENDEYKSIKPQAHYGHADHFLENIHLSWSEGHPHGRGPGGRTIRDGKAVIVEDLALDPTYSIKEEALQQGYLALVSLPLRHKGHTFGLLGMYSGESRSFAADELRLLQDLADNLASGICNIQAEKERQHLNAAMLKLAKAVSATRGAAFFEELVRNMVDTTGAQAGYIARLLPEKPLKGRMIATLVDGELVDNFDFNIPDVLADTLFGQKDFHIVSHHAAKDFPHMSMMRFHQYEAFAGLRLHDVNGYGIGLIFVFFHVPVKPRLHDLVRSTMKIFAARSASEIEILEADARIHEQAALLDKTHDAIVVRDLDHRITFWNKGAEALYGWTEAEALGQPIERLLQLPPTTFQQAVKELMANDEWSGEIVEHHKNGAALVIESHWSLVRDQEGKPKSIFAIKTDISSRKIAEEEIRKLAFYDPLTKLPNRRLLMDRLEKALASTARTRQFGALIFVDLDNFKTLNDTLGHDKGDILLKGVAERLQKCIRERDTAARLGGDEFVIMVEDLNDLKDRASILARVIGEKILIELNNTFDFDGYQHKSTPSIGIALFNHETESVAELLKQADIAMYKSKTAGRNMLTFYD